MCYHDVETFLMVGFTMGYRVYGTDSPLRLLELTCQRQHSTVSNYDALTAYVVVIAINDGY